MDHPSLSLAARLVLPERDFGQSIIDVRGDRLIVLDLALSHPIEENTTTTSSVRIPFTPSVSVQSSADAADAVGAAPPPPWALHCRWRGCRTGALLRDGGDGVCARCARRAEGAGRAPSIVDFHAESDSVPVVGGLVRVHFTITCPWFHGSHAEDEDANLELVMSRHDTPQKGDGPRITLPYHFVLERTIDTGDDSMETTRAPEPAPFAYNNNPAAFPDPHKTALQAKPHRSISLVQESFPNTFQRFEDLAETDLPLEESLKEVLGPLREVGDAIHLTNAASQTMAHLAALHDCGDLVQEMVDLGVDIETTDNTGHTPEDYLRARRAMAWIVGENRWTFYSVRGRS